MTIRSPFLGYHVSQPEALQLFAHHLMMTIRLYEVIEESNQRTQRDVAKALWIGQGFDAQEVRAAMELMERLWEHYQSMERYDDPEV